MFKKKETTEKSKSSNWKFKRCRNFELHHFELELTN